MKRRGKIIRKPDSDRIIPESERIEMIRNMPDSEKVSMFDSFERLARILETPDSFFERKAAL